MKKPIPRKRAGAASVPCPQCGSASQVQRTSLGARLRKSSRNYVLRERKCVSPAHHRFSTEERAK